MGQGGRRDGGRANEGAPSIRTWLCVRGRVYWRGDGVGRRGRVADWWPSLRLCPAEAQAGEGPGAAVVPVVQVGGLTTLKLVFCRWLQKSQHHEPTYVN
jgi:hypothetical protein